MTITNARIEVEPIDSLIDVPLAVRLEGLEPNERVTIRARATFSQQAGTWSTSTIFEADGQGKIDLNRQAPISGDFSEADVNGLIWSLRPDDSNTNARLLSDGLDPYELRIAVETKTSRLEQSIVRRAIAEDVEVVEVRDPSIQANLFLPKGLPPFPTVLVLGGSGGGFPDRQAALFASHGIAAVSLAYFGVEGLPPELRRIPLEYFESALDWIANHPRLRADRLAVSGTSRGGELALLLASRYPRIHSVVAYVPSSHVWGAISRIEDEESVDFFAAWTHGGRTIPYAGRVRNDAVAPDENGVVSLAPAYLNYAADTTRSDPALIPVECINGPVLLISGKADALWPSAHFGELIAERARSKGFDFAIDHLSYSGAGHSIGAGYGPTTVNQSYHPIRKAMIDLGGTPEGLAKARAESWPRVLAFVAQHTAPQAADVKEVSPVGN
jgi:dienelactone hydrolase